MEEKKTPGERLNQTTKDNKKNINGKNNLAKTLK